MAIQEVTVIGAGTMGAGIASAVISAGFTVHMIDITVDLLAKGKKSVEKILARSVEKEKITEAERANALQNIHYSTDLTTACSSQLVIEAVTENREIKTKLFARLCFNRSRAYRRDTSHYSQYPRSIRFSWLER